MVFKVVVIGAKGVGKTKLVDRVARDKAFTEDYKNTIGVEFVKKTFQDSNNAPNEFIIWDCGQQQNKSPFPKMYIEDADVVILCFDPRESASFDKLKDEFNSFTTNAKKDCQFILVATKSDDWGSAAISDEEIERFKSEHNIQHYVNVSAKDGTEIEQLRGTINSTLNGLVTLRGQQQSEQGQEDPEIPSTQSEQIAQPQTNSEQKKPEPGNSNSSFWLDALITVAAVGAVGLAIGALVGALVAALVVASVPLAIGLGVGLGAGAVVAGAVAIGTFFYRRSEEKQALADRSLETGYV